MSDLGTGLSVQPPGLDAPMPVVIPPSRPTGPKPTPLEWVKTNLFSGIGNSLTTVVVGLFVAQIFIINLLELTRGNLTWGMLSGWLISNDYEILRDNLRLWMVGNYPRDELWRPVVAGWLAVATIGVVSGVLFRNAQQTAMQAGTEQSTSRPTDMIRRFWPLLLLIGIFLSLTRTITPLLITIAGVALLMGGRLAGKALPAPIRAYLWFMVLFGLGGYMAIMTGEPTMILAVLSAALAWSLALRFAPAELAAIPRTVLTLVGGIIVIRLGQLVGFGRFIEDLPRDVLDIFGASTGLAIHPMAVLVISVGILAAVTAQAYRSAATGASLARFSLGLIAAGVAFLVGRYFGDLLNTRTEIGVGGAGWDDWGGLHLNLLVAVVGIVVAFPFGLLLALGRRATKDRSDPRSTTLFAIGGAVVGAIVVTIFFGTAAAVRPLGLIDLPFPTVVGAIAGAALGAAIPLSRQSSLPVFWGISVTLIEFIRGVPLITLLFFGDKMLRFLFPKGWEPPSTVSRAMIVVTMFSAAYIAEIVRGGLQAVSKGQIEAAQAVGLPAPKVLRLIVLPQALRAVIPAMVGQAISLWKDTSLLSFISLLEILKVSEIANAQPDFRGSSLSDLTLVFVAVIFALISLTMSKESQRLETKLSVGRAQR